MTDYRLLDLFCGVGGAAKGYQEAGFHVTGVDIEPQPRYVGDKFIQADALSWLGGSPPHGQVFNWEFFDAIHASPPCQSYSRALRHLATPSPMLIDHTRELLEATGLPWVIENVEGAPLASQDTLGGRYGIKLCGTAFGLRIEHHRLFESNVPLTGFPCNHTGPAMNPHNKEAREKYGWNEPEWALEKGITWTKHKREYRDAIPPVYTEHVGTQLIQWIRARERSAA